MTSTGIVCATALGFIASAYLCFSQDLPVCQLPINVVSILQADVAPADAEIHMEKDAGNSKVVNGIVHLYLRNEGPTRPDRLCASTHLIDIKDVPQAVSIALSEPGNSESSLKFDQNISCFKIEPPWKPFQEMPFDLHLRAGSTFIPLSGSINLNSNMTSKEPSAPLLPKQKAKILGRASSAQQSRDSSHDCASSSKLLTRPVMLLPSIHSSWLKLPLVGAFVIALAYLLISLVVLGQSLGESVGGPQWNFATSFATNFTIGTGLLTPLLGANMMTQALHYMTKFQYALLSILFAALLVLAPGIFWFFSIPQEITAPTGQTSTVSVGSVGLFLATAALMICAVLGQLMTVGLAIAEIRFRGYIGGAPMVVMLCLLLVAGIGTIFSAIRTIGSYLGDEAEFVGPSSEDLRSIGQKFSSISPGAALKSADSDMFTARERKTIQHVMGGGPKREIRMWRMF
jgi:hypothetical protein